MIAKLVSDTSLNKHLQFSLYSIIEDIAEWISSPILGALPDFHVGGVPEYENEDGAELPSIL